MIRQLVINADDFGLTDGVNQGIVSAYANGVLTSTSLFANAPATAEAIRLSQTLPALGIGAHLTLVDGAPTLSARQIPSLVTDGGRFRSSWRPFIVACLRGQVSMAEVEQELTAQIERLQDAGIALTHVDAHKHVHAYPPIFAIVARLAVRFGVPVVRVPYEQPSPVSWDAEAADARRTTRRQAWLNAAMWPWARRNYRTAAALGLRTPRFAGRIHTGVLSRSALRALIRAIRPGVTELMVHPGLQDAALKATGTRLLQSREAELALLCGLETRAVLARERIELVRHDLAHPVRRSLRHVS
jgi:chitin disaccharide deacetylase